MRNLFIHTRISARISAICLATSLLLTNLPLTVLANEDVTLDDCLTPDASSVLEEVNFGESFGSEPSLQQILTDNGYSIDVVSDQTNYEFWDVPDGLESINLTVKLIDGYSSYNHVFGYYINGDPETFVGIFERGDHTGYSLSSSSPGDIVEIEVPSSEISSIGFAINIDESNNKFFTEISHNPNGEIHAVVYNPSSDNYILGFEDLGGDNWDEDYQDVVVEINAECTSLPPPPPPPPPPPIDPETSTNNGGGGGGSSGGGSSGSSAAPIVPTPECLYLQDYLRVDLSNDPIEVLKLQAFLINFEGHTNISLTGVFDQATFDAVSAFQTKYASDILEPWGYTDPTGYVYILTLKKINEIYCHKVFPLNEAQINEIIAFRVLLESSRESILEEGIEVSTTTPPTLPVVGEAEPSQGQNLRDLLAAALFARPETLLDTAKCIYGFILILITLYILGNVLESVLYKNTYRDRRKRFLTRWLVISIGLVASIVAAYILDWWCLTLPLLISLSVSIIWILTYSKHNSMRASVKSWYLVISAWIKSALREVESPNAKTVIPLPPESTGKGFSKVHIGATIVEPKK